jgi:hypothetical protein
MQAGLLPNASLSSYVSNGDTVETGFYVVEGCGAEGCDWGKAMRNVRVVLIIIIIVFIIIFFHNC